MRIDGKQFRTIWLSPDPQVVQIIDQRHLPHQFIIEDLVTVDDFARAIQEMHVRGAGLIGATAGYGMYAAARVAGSSVWSAFPRYKRHLPAARRRDLERLWTLRHSHRPS